MLTDCDSNMFQLPFRAYSQKKLDNEVRTRENLEMSARFDEK